MFGAGNETRTRDLNLGKVALYQLSYSRILSLELYIEKMQFSPSLESKNHVLGQSKRRT